MPEALYTNGRPMAGFCLSLTATWDQSGCESESICVNDLNSLK
jgi:hypothetical protein